MSVGATHVANTAPVVLPAAVVGGIEIVRAALVAEALHTLALRRTPPGEGGVVEVVAGV